MHQEECNLFRQEHFFFFGSPALLFSSTEKQSIPLTHSTPNKDGREHTGADTARVKESKRGEEVRRHEMEKEGSGRPSTRSVGREGGGVSSYR